LKIVQILILINQWWAIIDNTRPILARNFDFAWPREALVGRPFKNFYQTL